jgi:uncharacterized protein YbjT (DUF2867 family)
VLVTGATGSTGSALVDLLVQRGVPLQGIVPEWQIGGLLEDDAHYSRGEAAAGHPGVEEVTGRPPRGVAAFARDYAPAFGGAAVAGAARVAG